MYLTLLVEYSRKYALQIEGFCLMTNHVHLVVVPERADSLAKAIGRAHNDYSRWMHVRQRRTGHLWQNRFHSCVMDDRHRWEALGVVQNRGRSGTSTRLAVLDAAFGRGTHCYIPGHMGVESGTGADGGASLGLALVERAGALR